MDQNWSVGEDVDGKQLGKFLSVRGWLQVEIYAEVLRGYILTHSVFSYTSNINWNILTNNLLV